MKKLAAIICAVLIVSAAVVSVSAADTDAPDETPVSAAEDVSEPAEAGEPDETDVPVDTDIPVGENDFNNADEPKKENVPAVQSDEPVTCGDFTVSGGSYSYADGVLTVSGGAPITISGTTSTDRIVVDSASGANITLSGVNIDASNIHAPAFEIMAGSGSVTVILDDNSTNTLKSGVNNNIGFAGLQNNCVPVTITGSGSLTATGGTYGGAGIGGCKGGNGENITIGKSNTTDVEFTGTITATGSNLNAGGAGIGGGSSSYDFSSGGYIGGNGTNIKISGSGTVNANGNRGGAGIGGGEGGSGTYITINMCDKGQVIAKSDEKGGAAIGGGMQGGNGTDITISGSVKVIATGGDLGSGAGIGGGGGGDGTKITISGSATVEATGGDYGAGIGGGSYGDGTDITISGSATVEATGSYDGGAGIGGGKGGKGGTDEKPITISGGNVTATSGYAGGAGIGGGKDGGGANVTISGGNVIANGTDTGIGGEGSTVTIVSVKGTSETSYPWVETNGIERTNEDVDYCGIVLDKTQSEYYGTVYGTVKLTEPYTIEAGKTLRVHKNAALKTGDDLTLAGTLYLEDGAKLEYWYDITIVGNGEIQHKAKSDYKEYASGTYNLTYAERDSEEKTYLCDICGTAEPHKPTIDDEWKNDSTHHWHDGSCDLTDAYDCSVDKNKIEKCSYMVDGKFNYEEHEYGEPVDEGSVLRYTCTVCGYSYTENKQPVVTQPTPTETAEPTETIPPTETTVPTETTAPDVTTVPSGGGNRPSPSYYPPVTTTVTSKRTETEYYPNEYTGDDVSAEAGYYEKDSNGMRVLPPIILIVLTGASAFVLYRREKK